MLAGLCLRSERVGQLCGMAPETVAASDVFEASLPSLDRLEELRQRAQSRELVVPDFLPADTAAAHVGLSAAEVLEPAFAPFAAGSQRGAMTVVAMSGSDRSEVPVERQFDPRELVERTLFGHGGAVLWQDALLDNGLAARSLVLRYEAIEGSQQLPSFAAKLMALRDDVAPAATAEQQQPPPRTLHLYVSGPGGSALPPHMDPHDAFILGVYGEKHWSVCTPPATSPSLPWRLRTKMRYQCGNVPPKDISTHLSCEQYVVRAGDLLFIPAQHFHWGNATAAGSAHLTLGAVTDGGRMDRLSAIGKLVRLGSCAVVRPAFIFEAFENQHEGAVLLTAVLRVSTFIIILIYAFGRTPVAERNSPAAKKTPFFAKDVVERKPKGD